MHAVLRMPGASAELVTSGGRQEVAKMQTANEQRRLNEARMQEELRKAKESYEALLKVTLLTCAKAALLWSHCADCLQSARHVLW